MITDPGTSPVRPRNQFAFGALTGALYGVFTGLHVVYGMFFGLVVVCALRGLVLWGVWLRDAARRDLPSAVAASGRAAASAGGGRLAAPEGIAHE
jgi:enediyne biosynthesis protein E5